MSRRRSTYVTFRPPLWLILAPGTVLAIALATLAWLWVMWS